jgi:hypothetical protein
LHTAVSDNKAAFNLPNAFIDTFEDNTGTTTRTDVSNVSEYFASVVVSTTVDAIESKWANSSSTPAASDARTFSTNNVIFTSGDDAFWLNDTFTGDFEFQLTWYNGSYTGTDWAYGISFVADEPGVLTSTQQRQYNNPSAWLRSGGWPYHQATSENGNVRLFDIGSVILFKRVGAVFTVYDDGVLDHTWTYENSAECRFGLTSGGGATNWELRDMTYSGTGIAGDAVASATGTLVSTAQTAPVATTTLSGVILYTDEFGTNTLGSGASDNLAIYLTANLQGSSPSWIGTNWTEAASYGTPQTFSGTTKQVKLGKTTVTSGTQVAMKAVWANQVTSTKVAQLNGWAVNY